MKAACCAILLALPGPLLAQDRIVLEFEGSEMAFTFDDPQARAGFTRFMSVDAVSFEAVAGAARLVIELSLPPGGDAPHDARIMFRPDGWRDYWLSPLIFPDGGVVVSQLALRGTAPHIEGQFETPLCFTASPMTLPDPDRCVPARGHFRTRLHPD